MVATQRAPLLPVEMHEQAVRVRVGHVGHLVQPGGHQNLRRQTPRRRASERDGEQGGGEKDGGIKHKESQRSSDRDGKTF